MIAMPIRTAVLPLRRRRSIALAFIKRPSLFKAKGNVHSGAMAVSLRRERHRLRRRGCRGGPSVAGVCRLPRVHRCRGLPQRLSDRARERATCPHLETARVALARQWLNPLLRPPPTSQSETQREGPLPRRSQRLPGLKSLSAYGSRRSACASPSLFVQGTQPRTGPPSCRRLSKRTQALGPSTRDRRGGLRERRKRSRGTPPGGRRTHFRSRAR